MSLISLLANNQFIINTEHGQYFQSYETLIAFKPKDGSSILVSDSWDCSATTLKYFKQFAGLNSYSKKQIQKMIDSGAIILAPDLEV